jgi:hypothetical protein
MESRRVAGQARAPSNHLTPLLSLVSPVDTVILPLFYWKSSFSPVNRDIMVSSQWTIYPIFPFVRAFAYRAKAAARMNRSPAPDFLAIFPGGSGITSAALTYDFGGQNLAAPHHSGVPQRSMRAFHAALPAHLDGVFFRRAPGAPPEDALQVLAPLFVPILPVWELPEKLLRPPTLPILLPQLLNLLGHRPDAIGGPLGRPRIEEALDGRPLLCLTILPRPAVLRQFAGLQKVVQYPAFVQAINSFAFNS